MSDIIYIEAAARQWAWPKADTKCRAVVFDELVALPTVYRHLKAARTAVQAGGNMGVFPVALARKFQWVLTAEPDPLCYQCLRENIRYEKNIEALPVALGDREGEAQMFYPSPDNRGAQRIEPGRGVLVAPIDAFGITDCDLIYLDIEGAELLALKGAKNTIALTKPVIAIEDKGLSEHFGSRRGDAGRWLEQTFGYRLVGKSKRDVIYACE